MNIENQKNDKSVKETAIAEKMCLRLHQSYNIECRLQNSLRKKSELSK